MMLRFSGSDGKRSARLDFMVALGTHTPMPKDILSLYGINAQKKVSGSSFFNHEWDRQETLPKSVTLPHEVERISEGLLKEKVPIVINKKIFDYDLVLILGPVFPHEVVGYSGGAKYLFPGISGGDFLHFFHWLGAVMTCKKIIGIKDTPVRRTIDKARKKVPVPVHCLAMVVNRDSSLCGLYVGDVREAWSKAADLSSRFMSSPREALQNRSGQAPAMYDEIWTGGKVMYKLEQVVADQGTLIIYAPHVRDLKNLGEAHRANRIPHEGLFSPRMEQFRDVPRGVLAHLTMSKEQGP